MIKSMAWIDKYKPNTLEECFLPEKTFNELNKYIENDNIPTMFFTGPSGIGKTTVAEVICKQGEYENMFINASLAGIDAVRSDIQNFASSVSLNGKRKIIILDEADGLTSAAQEALRGVINEFVNNVSFILTANFRNKIIEPLISRSVEVEFLFNPTEYKTLALGLFKFIKNRLDNDNITYDINAVQSFIKENISNTTDIRKILLTAQRISQTGTFNFNSIININDNRLSELLTFIKLRDFDKIRQWVVDNNDLNNSTIIKYIYDNHNKLNIKGKVICSLILILNEYQYKNGFVVDKEINNIAMLIEIIGLIK